MKTLKLLISLIIINATLVAGRAYGYAESEQSLDTTVQPAVSIEKLSSSKETGSINPETGVQSGLESVFSLQTNGTDSDYDFILSSKITTDGGEYSAYGENGCLLFVNTLATPTAAAIEDAKTGGNNNPNVIAYPVTVTTSSPFTNSFSTSNSQFGACYVINVNNGTEGTVTHIVGKTPVSGSYSVAQDQAGTYQATVTLSAVSK